MPPVRSPGRQQSRRGGADALVHRLRRSGILKLLRCELSIDAVEGKLTGSGLIVVNPPFPLERELRVLLPVLVQVVAPTSGSYRLDWLSRE